MEFRASYLVSIFLGLFILVSDFVFFFDFKTFETARWFVPLIVIALLVATLQFWLAFFKENKRQKEIEEKFIEFVRAVVGSVKSGITIPKSILNASKGDYGALTPYVKKLANQIEWGMPTQDALIRFSKETGNIVIKRSIAIVTEAEKSGGNMADILDSVATSVAEIKKMKEERRAGIYSQVVQGYIVFFIFIGIMLVLQLKLLPQISGISQLFAGGIGMGGVEQRMNLNFIFLSLVEIQGFFAGLVIGKFSEGSVRYGIKHSLILMVVAYLIMKIVGG